MIRPKKILAPTDLSKLSLAAVRYALEMALEQNAEVIVYNVIGEDGEWFGKNEAGVPYILIVKKAEEENADLIVMSTHGRTGIEQLMLGSVTAKVVARASCPVLSIRPKA